MGKHYTSIASFLLALIMLLAVSCNSQPAFIGKEVSNASELEEALMTGGNIRLLEDIVLTETLKVSNDTVILLNGKTISGDGVRAFLVDGASLELAESGVVTSTVAAVGSSVIRVGGTEASASLIIGRDAVIDAKTSYGVSVFGSGEESVTVNGTIISSAPANASYDGCAIATLGTDTTVSKITINEGALLTADNTNAIYMPSGNLIVNGGTITGTTGIYIKSGSTVIKGGTITGKGDANAYTSYGNGGKSTGDALVVDNCGYPNGAPSVSVTGGRFISENAEAVGSYSTGEYKAADCFISGGVFSTDPADLLAPGYSSVSVTEGEKTLFSVEYGISDFASLKKSIEDFAAGSSSELVLKCSGSIEFEGPIIASLTDKTLRIIGEGADSTEFIGFPVDPDASLQMGMAFYFKLFGDAAIDIEGISFRDFARYGLDGNPITGDKDNYGQGVYVSGSSDDTATTKISGCSFEGLGGRGFVSIGAGNIEISRCVFNAEDRHYSTLNVIEIFGGTKVEVLDSVFRNVKNMSIEWPSAAIAIFDTTGNWVEGSTVLIDGCVFENCDDYCISHELCYDEKAPIPTISNAEYRNCYNAIAHVYTSVITDSSYKGAVSSIFATQYYTDYLAYSVASTDDEGIRYETHYYSTSMDISFDCIADSFVLNLDFPVVIKEGVTLTVIDKLMVTSGDLRGEEGAKLVIYNGCAAIINGSVLGSGTYSWDSYTSSWMLD